MLHVKHALVILAGMAIFLAAGCSSNRISMSPAPALVSVPANNSTFYSIQDAKLSLAGILPTDWKGGGFASEFTRTAEGRYPSLFKRTQGAYPLAVKVEGTMKAHDGPALLVFVGTLGIIGGILPSVPWSTDWQFAVLAEDARGADLFSTQMQAEHGGWWSVASPFGLMTVPGQSDVPKVSRVFTGGPGITPKPLRDGMVVCMVDQLAAELLRLDGRVTLSPNTESNVPSVLSTGQPTLLPPPSNSTTPF